MTSDLSPGVNDRFQVSERPIRKPGNCACCGSASKPVVSFGTNILRYGCVYLCVDCVTEAATKFGMVPKTTLEDNSQETSQLVESYLSQHNFRVVTNELYDAVNRLIDFVSSSNSSVSTAQPEKASSKTPVATGGEGDQGVLSFDGIDLFDEAYDDSSVGKGSNSLSDGFSL